MARPACRREHDDARVRGSASADPDLLARVYRGHARGSGRKVVHHARAAERELFVEVSHPILERDGLGFEPPPGVRGTATGFSAQRVRTIGERQGRTLQAIWARDRVPQGWRVVRNAESELLARARQSYEGLEAPLRTRKAHVSVRLFGAAGAPLKAIWQWEDEEVVVRSATPLAPADRQPLDETKLREQLGRLGETPFVLTQLDAAGLARGLFLPVSELNRLRTEAVDELLLRRDWAAAARNASRAETIASVVDAAPRSAATSHDGSAPWRLVAQVYTPDAAREAAAAGATEVVFDPFLRHPVPPVARVTALASELADAGVMLRLRTPTIIRPEDRRSLTRWLAADLPILSGHVGLALQLAGEGRDVVADYAVNAFNPLTADEYFTRGVRRIVASVELTVAELAALTAPWGGTGFDVVVFGRPEGMTIEHCVLSAAFDRVATTCRDLCVKLHPVVELTDPAGYTFPVATDSACRNRLLHSRPIEASEFLPGLWKAGLRGYHLLFNVATDPVAPVVAATARALGALARGDVPDETAALRTLLGQAFTRGHFQRAV